MSTTNQICRSYKNDQSVCIIACHGIVTEKATEGIGKTTRVRRIAICKEMFSYVQYISHYVVTNNRKLALLQVNREKIVSCPKNYSLRNIVRFGRFYLIFDKFSCYCKCGL